MLTKLEFLFMAFQLMIVYDLYFSMDLIKSEHIQKALDEMQEAHSDAIGAPKVLFFLEKRGIGKEREINKFDSKS